MSLFKSLEDICYMYIMIMNGYSFRRRTGTVVVADIQASSEAGKWQSGDLAKAEAIWGTPHAYGRLRTSQHAGESGTL